MGMNIAEERQEKESTQRANRWELRGHREEQEE
jgi:hypothetical protein